MDTADVYGHGRSECFAGRLVADAPRDSVVLVSKVGYFAGTAPHGYHPLLMRHQLEQSLDNLRPEHLDAYFMHHPNFGPDDRYFRPPATLKLARMSKPLVGVLRYRLISLNCMNTVYGPGGSACSLLCCPAEVTVKRHWSAAGMGLSASALAMLDQIRRRMDAVLDSSHVSEHTMEYWQQTPHEYAQRYQVTPPRELLADVVSDFAEVQQLLTHQQPMRQRTELCRISGQLAVLIGIFLAALAKKREARAWFRTATLAAREADDPQLAGLAMVRAGIVSFYHDAPEAALEHSERARSLLGDAPSPWLVRGLVVEARANHSRRRLEKDPRCLTPLKAQLPGVFSIIATNCHDLAWHGRCQ